MPAGAVDRDGKPRASDGNSDCVPVSDIGAFEYQGAAAAACTAAPAAPATGGAATAPAATAAPRMTRLRVEPTHVQIGTALPKLVHTSVRRPLSTIRFAAHLTRKVTLAPGAYRVTAVATTKAGARSKPARARFTAISPTRRETWPMCEPAAGTTGPDRSLARARRDERSERSPRHSRS